MVLRRLVRSVGWPHALVMLVAVCVPEQALAQSTPQRVTEIRTQVGTSINNLGVQFGLEWSHRRRLAAPDAGPIRSDAHVQFGAGTSLSPSFGRIGAWVQLAPVSFVVVRAGVEPGVYFGTFNSLVSFDRRDAAFDPDSRRDRGGASTGTAARWYLSPSVRLRIGRVVASATADVERWSASVRGPFFHEPMRDTLLAVDGDTLVGLRHVVMYERTTTTGTRLAVGGLHTLQRAGGFATATLNQVQKLGGLFTWQSSGRRMGVSRPSLTIAVARYLNDPSKQHGWTASATFGGALRRREAF